MCAVPSAPGVVVAKYGLYVAYAPGVPFDDICAARADSDRMMAR